MMDLYKEWHVGDAKSKEMIARRYVERFHRLCGKCHEIRKCEMTKPGKTCRDQKDAGKSESR